MSNQVLYAGNNLISAADKLSKVPLDYIYHSLKNPKESMITQIRNLRIIMNIDKQKYSSLKRNLPYLVCGVFNPTFRRTENFAYIENFFVDIDHISQKGKSVDVLRHEIEKDSRVVMTFISPSNDGLKILFHLSERCYDAGIYSLFYKVFTRSFSEQYHLEQVIDAQTCDVCRACFMSVDSDAYFNVDAEDVKLEDFLNQNDASSIFDIKKEEEKRIKEDNQNVEKSPKIVDPDKESIQKIKDILKLKSRKTKENNAYVPQQLNDIMDDLHKYVEDTGIIITEIININYGKKIRMKMGNSVSEINVFYGKHGFSVVLSPRSGTSEKLNDVCAELLKSFFKQM